MINFKNIFVVLMSTETFKTVKVKKKAIIMKQNKRAKRDLLQIF